MAGRIGLLAIGRERIGPPASWADDFLDRITRLERSTQAELVRLPSSKKKRAQERRLDEASRIRQWLDKRERRTICVALDSAGDSMTSSEFEQFVERSRAAADLVFVVGGPDGLDPRVTQECDRCLSLGRMTLPHELALVVLLEQIYRALASAQNHPYTRH